MNLWVLVPNWVLEDEDVLALVEQEPRWLSSPGNSIPGGDGGPVFRAAGFLLLHPSWDELTAKLYARQWEPMRLEQIEVSDVFAERLGIRQDGNPSEVA